MFTHLDPNDHQREFQLGVHVVVDNRYTGAPILHSTCRQYSGHEQKSAWQFSLYKTNNGRCCDHWPSACVFNDFSCLFVQ